MFTIALEKTRTFNLTSEGGSCSLTVRYKVPTCVDVDSLERDIKDTALFRKFVLEITSDYEELDGIMPSEFVKLPLFYVVSQIAKDIIKSAYFLPEEKNA